MRAWLALGVWLACGSIAGAGNVLLIVADDVGVGSMNAYGIGAETFPSPHLDRLAADGIVFTNAWSMPICCPTRACIQTGRHSFRTGVGYVLALSDELSYDETTIPKSIAARCGIFGKWHLGNDPYSPNLHGYQMFKGSLGGGLTSYYLWARTVNGVTLPSLTYATSCNVDDALQWIRRQRGDWFCCLNFNAGHIPLHKPPPWLHSDRIGKTLRFADPLQHFLAMLEAMDSEIGRLLADVDLKETTVIFVGDNGDSRYTAQPPFDPNRCKTTVYEGGVWVPLFISGRGVVNGGRTVPHIVNVVDLYATIVQLMGGDASTGEDSVSLVLYMLSPQQAPRREYSYAEIFLTENTYPEFDTFQARTIRSQRYKLIQRAGMPEELYDLQADRFEKVDLIHDPGYAGIIEELRTAMEALTGETAP